MLKIDTHYHSSTSWWEPIEVLLFHMKRCGIQKAVLCQHKTQYDNSYLVNCARRYPERFSVVGHVDVTKPDAVGTLATWSAKGMTGLRLWASDRSPGRDPFAIWHAAARLKLVVSCPGTMSEYGSDEFAQVVQAVPNMPIVLEHLGLLTSLKQHAGKALPKPPYTAYKKMLRVARFPNVYMKIPGFGEYMPVPIPASDPPFDLAKAPPFMDVAVAAFGPKRLMVGADPNSSVHEGYANVWGYLAQYLSRYSRSDREWIFGKTAEAVFNFGAPSRRKRK